MINDAEMQQTTMYFYRMNAVLRDLFEFSTDLKF